MPSMSGLTAISSSSVVLFGLLRWRVGGGGILSGDGPSAAEKVLIVQGELVLHQSGPTQQCHS